MVNHKGVELRGSVKRGLRVAAFTFIIAFTLSANSQLVLTGLKIPIAAFSLLVLVVLVGIIFDIIGVAVAVADEAPFHARACRKLDGAHQALNLIRNADKVSNFCCDVVGDICGTLSGSLGAAIVFTLPWNNGSRAWLASALMAGFVAAITVGGKAISKSYAIKEANTVIDRVSKLIFWLNSFINKPPKRGKNNLKGKNK